MTSLYRTRARLEHAVGLTAVMDAAYDAFENLLAVIREHEDPASGLFAAFMFAAASAANGRDAILFAPSLRPPATPTGPRRKKRSQRAPLRMPQMLPPTWVTCWLRLLEAGEAAADPGDRAACLAATQCAAEIRVLLRRSAP